MEIEQSLREAIDRRKNTFDLVAATISLPLLRHTQLQSYTETLTFKPDEYFSRLAIEQFRTHTELLIEDANYYLLFIPEDHSMLTHWQNYINELKQQQVNLTELLNSANSAVNGYYYSSQ